MKKLDIDIEGFLRLLGNSSASETMHKVILYGTGRDLRGYVFELEFISQMLLQKGEIQETFLDRIFAAVDGNSRKQGQKLMLGDKEIYINPPQFISEIAHDEAKDVIVLVTASRYAWEIGNILKAMRGAKDMAYVVAAELRCPASGTIGNMLPPRVFRRLMRYWSDEYDYKDIPSLQTTLDRWLAGDTAIIPEIGIKLTHRCTLSCKNCLDRVPFLPKTDVPLDEVMRDIELLDKNAVYIGRLLFITGEVLIYPHFDKVLAAVIDHPKIHEIMINTNGTVRPSDAAVPYLQNRKCKIYISDYGDIVSMAKAVDYYERNDIDFAIRAEMKWKSIGHYPKSRGLSVDELKKEYASCGVGNSCPPILTQGKIFPCGVSSLFYALGEYRGTRDYADMHGLSGAEFKEKFYNIMNMDYLESCDMCDVSVNGSSVENVDPGEQKDPKRQWHRSRYTIIERVQ